MLYFVCILVLQSGYFAIVLQTYCYYECSVTFPYVAMVWPEVCDFGIS